MNILMEKLNEVEGRIKAVSLAIQKLIKEDNENEQKKHVLYRCDFKLCRVHSSVIRNQCVLSRTYLNRNRGKRN